MRMCCPAGWAEIVSTRRVLQIWQARLDGCNIGWTKSEANGTLLMKWHHRMAWKRMLYSTTLNFIFKVKNVKC